jgi:hypothetical protein
MAPKIARASAIEPVFINSESTAGFYPSVTRKSNPPICTGSRTDHLRGRRREFIFKLSDCRLKILPTPRSMPRPLRKDQPADDSANGAADHAANRAV